MDITLNGKTVILTGAGGGIGSVITSYFRKSGAKLILVDISEEFLDNVHNSAYDDDYYICDISDQKAVQEFFNEISRKYSRIDVLINNAGIQAPIGQFHTNALDLWKHNIEVNLMGTVYMSWRVIPVMIKQRKGKIINLSGGGSTSPRPNFSAYAVAKTGVVKFTEELAVELRDFGIDVNAISPGAINTQMLDEVLACGNIAGEEYMTSMKRKADGGNDPSIAAELICFLASNASDCITGKLISAPWDPWRELDFQDQLRNDKDLATLRRIDNKYYIRKS